MSNRLLAVYLHARCLDRVGAYAECAKFCDGWLKGIGDAPANISISEFAKTRIERVRAVTVSDGFSLGMMDGDRPVIYRGLLEFFAQVVGKQNLRENSDFCYLARHHEWMEQFEAAFAVIAAAEELYPEYWEVPFRKAEFQHRSGEHHAALEAAERATVLAPWRPQPWGLFAEILQSCGMQLDSERARKRMTEVKEIRRTLSDQLESQSI